MKISIPNELLDRLQAWNRRETCALCHGNGPFQRHHKRFRSHGGLDDETNLVLLCDVCHGAAHGREVIKNGHRCRTCPVLTADGCFFGERVLGLEPTTPAPWPLHLDSEGI